MYVDFDVRDRILIVGSGASGLSCATELRRLGFAGELVVMGDEPEGHYDRPACSKGILSGQKRPSDVITPLDPDLDVIWRLGRRAVSCDLERRVVEAHTGESIYFDGLVIATGARAVVPNDWPDDQPGMHVISGLQAAWNLRRDLRNVKRVAVVGGGVTGCEVACAVKDMARQAVIIEPRPFVMGRAVGSIVGHMVAASHKRAGIEIASGGRVTGLDYHRDKWHLTLKDGSTVTADIVVGTMGERPDLAWLDGTGIDTTDGVLCDPSLRVLDVNGNAVDGVVACGSIARWPNPRGNGKPQKVGQWIAAQEQGIGAARALMAGGRPVPAVSILPRFWTHQGGLRIEVCGEVDPKADIEVHELRPGKKDPAKAGVMATYTRKGKLIGAVAVNAPRLFTNTARMMRLDEPSVTVLPPLPAPVSPGVGPLEAPPPRLALGAAPQPAPMSPARALPALPSSADPRDYGYTGPEPTYGPGYTQPGYDPAYDRAGYEATYDRAGYDPMYDRTAYDPGYGQGYSQPDYVRDYGPAPYDPGYDERYANAGPDVTYVRGIDDTGNFPVPAGVYDQPPAGGQHPLVQEYQYGKTRGFGPPPRLANGPAAGSGYGPTSGPGFGANAYSGPAYGTPGYGSQSGYQRALTAGPERTTAHENASYDRYDEAGYEQGGYGQAGYDRGAQDQGGYDRGGYGQAAYDRGGYGQAGYGQGGYAQGADDRGGYGQAAYAQGGYGQAGYDRGAHDQGGYDRGGYGQAAYGDGGYDRGTYGQAAYGEGGYGQGDGHSAYGPDGYDQGGYGQGGYGQGGYEQGGGYDRAGHGQSQDSPGRGGYDQAASYNRGDYDQGGYGQGGHSQGGHGQGGHGQGGHGQGGYGQGGYGQGGHSQGGHGQGGYGQGGHSQRGYHQDGYEQAGYDRSGNGQDHGGYDGGGYDRSGYDRSGGYGETAHAQDGYNRATYSQPDRPGRARDDDRGGRGGYGRGGDDRDGFDRGYGPEPVFGPPQDDRYWQPRLAHVG